MFRSLLVPSGLCCFFFSFVSKQCLLEEKHCCCIFQNKVLQLLMQTLIKCTSLNLIFAGVSCHFLTETVRQTSTWHLQIFHIVFFLWYRLLYHQKRGSYTGAAARAGRQCNGWKYNKLLLTTVSISLNLWLVGS